MNCSKRKYMGFNLTVFVGILFVFYYGINIDTSLYAESQRTKKDSNLYSKRIRSSNLNQRRVTSFDDSDLYEARSSSDDEGSFLSSAVGLGLNWMLKKEYGYEYQKKIVPEGSIYTYFKIEDPFYIRNTIHFGYSWMQPQMPQSVKILEKELLLLTDLSFLYNWYVVPAVSVGAGSFYRRVSLEIDEPIHMEKDEISCNEWIFVWYLQFGVGFPVYRNILVLEPFARVLFLKDDKRTFFAFGFDFSFYLVKGW